MRHRIAIQWRQRIGRLPLREFLRHPIAQLRQRLQHFQIHGVTLGRHVIAAIVDANLPGVFENACRLVSELLIFQRLLHTAQAVCPLSIVGARERTVIVRFSSTIKEPSAIPSGTAFTATGLVVVSTTTWCTSGTIATLRNLTALLALSLSLPL